MYYFAYGSNMDEGQMISRCPKSAFQFIAKLPKYKLTFTKYSPRWFCGVADIVGDTNFEVWGLVYKITEKDLDNLDIYEGVKNNFYKRITVIVCNEKSSVNAITYTVVNKENFIQPSKEYLELIISAAETFAFPTKYISYLKSFKNHNLKKFS